MANKSYKIIIGVFVSFLNFLFFENVFAIGMVAEPLVIKDVMRGQEVSAITTVINTNKNQEVIYGISGIGEIKDWMSFYEKSDLSKPITEIKVPAKSDADFIVKFKIPENIEITTYNGEIGVFLKPSPENDGEKVQMAVTQGLQRLVTILLTGTPILKFNSEVIPFKYEVGRDEPLQLKVTYDNEGNTIIKPDLKLKITNERGETIDEVKYSYPEGLEPVNVHERKTLPTITWRTNGVPGGKYTVKAEVLLENKSYFKKEFNLFIGFNLSNYSASLLGIIGITNLNKTQVACYTIFGCFILVLGVLYIKKKFIKKETSIAS